MKMYLTESELNGFITECVRRCINELHAQRMPNQRINHSNNMQMAVDNGGRPQGADDYLAKENTYYGKIAKLAQSNNTRYTDVISDLQQKMSYYLTAGYFGSNQEVLQTIKLFIELLAYLHASYEAAVSSVMKKQGLNEWLDGLRYRKQNRYGVQQHVKDDSGNKYAVANQKNGQWMTDLQNELNQMLQWNFLHGPKTIEATKLLIEFLNVEKRAFFMWFDRRSSKILKGIKHLLIGITVLATLGPSCGPQDTPEPTPDYEPQIEMQATQQQQIQVQFQINSAELSPEFAEQIQNLPQGNYKIIVHETQNTSGKDASYESQLVQQRGQAIQNLMQGSNVTIERGENVIGNMAFCDIMPM